MIDQRIDRNKECSVNIRLIRGEVAILAGLNSLDVYYSNIVPEARNRLPRVSVRNSLLGLVPQTYLLVNVYTHTHTRDIDGYRSTSPKFYCQNPETRRNSALGTPQILKYFHWKIPSKDGLIKVLLRVSWLADRFRWFDDKQRQPCYRIQHRFSIKQCEFRSLKV